jgi:hypothetical protein
MNYLDDKTQYMNLPCSIEAGELASLIDNGIVTDSIMERIWSATTNRRSCGGLNRTAQAVIYRALKRAGYRYWLLMERNEETGEWISSWGLSQKPPAGAVTGYSMHHAAHKLGQGDAARGWQIYWRSL